MAYDRKVERAHPTLIQMIMDDSQSMSTPFENTGDTRYQWVEMHSAAILTELLARSTTLNLDTPVVRARYFLDVIRYGTSVAPWNDEPLDIGAAAQKFDAQHASFGLGGNLGGTDSALAFQTAYDRMQAAITHERFRESFPPMVFHLTDGESQTNAEPIAQKLAALSTSDGNVLIVNAFIGTQTELHYNGPQDFPGYVTEAEVGPNGDMLRLFRMSSLMPETIRENLIADGIFPVIRSGARLFFDIRTEVMLKQVLAVVGSTGSRVRT